MSTKDWIEQRGQTIWLVDVIRAGHLRVRYRLDRSGRPIVPVDLRPEEQ